MGATPDEKFEVFLSHAHIDADVVERLASLLEDTANIKNIWLDKWVLVPGERWQQGMARGLDLAKTCAVCVGQHTPKGWFREEIERALNRQTKDPSFRVIPVILPDGDPAAIDDFLELRTWVDFRGGLSDQRALHVLVSGINGLSPGRNIYQQETEDAILRPISEKLQQIPALRRKELIDDDIALEYQRRLLDQLVKS